MDQPIKMYEQQCPVEAVVNLIGGKWKILILYHIAVFKVRRFNELKNSLTPITHRTLTRQLREMEGDGLLSRIIYAEVPPKVEYTLTPTGESLMPVLITMQNWGVEYLQKQ